MLAADTCKDLFLVAAETPEQQFHQNLLHLQPLEAGQQDSSLLLLLRQAV